MAPNLAPLARPTTSRTGARCRCSLLTARCSLLAWRRCALACRAIVQFLSQIVSISTAFPPPKLSNWRPSSSSLLLPFLPAISSRSSTECRHISCHRAAQTYLPPGRKSISPICLIGSPPLAQLDAFCSSQWRPTAGQTNSEKWPLSRLDLWFQFRALDGAARGGQFRAAECVLQTVWSKLCAADCVQSTLCKVAHQKALECKKQQAKQESSRANKWPALWRHQFSCISLTILLAFCSPRRSSKEVGPNWTSKQARGFIHSVCLRPRPTGALETPPSLEAAQKHKLGMGVVRGSRQKESLCFPCGRIAARRHGWQRRSLPHAEVCRWQPNGQCCLRPPLASWRHFSEFGSRETACGSPPRLGAPSGSFGAHSLVFVFAVCLIYAPFLDKLWAAFWPCGRCLGANLGQVGTKGAHLALGGAALTRHATVGREIMKKK